MGNEKKNLAESVQNVAAEVIGTAITKLGEGASFDQMSGAALVTLLAQSAKEAVPHVVELMKSTPADRQLAAAVVQADFAAAVESVRPQLEEKLEALLGDEKVDKAGLGTNAAVIADAARRARARTADARKARVIMAAMVNAFDRDAYEAGLTVRLLGLLESLDYGEIRTLALQHGTERLSSFYPLDPGSLMEEHARRLVDARLMRFKDLTTNDRVVATELGKRMLKLIEGGLPDDPARD
jgi:hypothetical protein